MYTSNLDFQSKRAECKVNVTFLKYKNNPFDPQLVISKYKTCSNEMSLQKFTCVTGDRTSEILLDAAVRLGNL